MSLTSAHVAAAAQRLDGIVVRTPLLRSPGLDALTGGAILLKPECLQRTGSFKIRGAYNRLAQLTDEQRAAGVVAFSSGNHAQGVAYAGQLLGIATTIVMPADAPALKIAGTRAYGAQVVLYDRLTESREAIAARIAAEQGSVTVPSFDDPDVIAGQGTIGCEIAEDAAALGLAPDTAVICCSGGGLASGIALGLRGALPQCAIITAEPAGYDDMARSLALGERVTLDEMPPTLCDALQAPAPGLLTLPILLEAGASGVAVTSAQVIAAMRFAFSALKLVLEPGGAVALAAVLSGTVPTRGRTVAVVLSGGNVDPAVFAGCLVEP